MLVYYDPDTGTPKFSMIAMTGIAPLPGDYIEAPDEEGLELQHYRIENGTLVRLDAEALADTRAAALAEVNRISGEIRSRFITVIPGQEMLYLLKEQEALEWMLAPEPRPEDFPLLQSEIGLTGATLYDVAIFYINEGRALRFTAAPLETLRLGTVVTIEGAADIAAIEAALAQFHAAIQ